jgi:diaminopimelate epimerase
MKLDFIKMNGAGNDFIIFDARKQALRLSAEQIRFLSARDNNVTKGCDQLLILRDSDKADVFMQIYNADGGEVDACGNATRCIADMLYKELGRLPVTIETNAGVLRGVKQQDGYILVDMGAPKFEWRDIPLAMPLEEASAKIKTKFGLENPVFVSMGNPHAVFFLEEVPGDYEISKIGSQIENCTEIFPERVNVSFAKNTSNIIEAKTWERGAGLTSACGTGACAMLAAANKINNEINGVTVLFENSNQRVSVKIENRHLLLGGEIEKEFEGTTEI